MLSSHDSEQAFQNFENTAFFEGLEEAKSGSNEEEKDEKEQYIAGKCAEKKARDPETPALSASGPPSAVVATARASSTKGGSFAESVQKTGDGFQINAQKPAMGYPKMPLKLNLTFLINFN